MSINLAAFYLPAGDAFSFVLEVILLVPTLACLFIFFCKSSFFFFYSQAFCLFLCTLIKALSHAAVSVSAESHSPHGRPQFVHRDDRTSKTYERLQKKLKERQGGGGGGGGGGQVKDSPPPSPQKNCSSPQNVDIHNGFGGKGPEAEQGHLGHGAAGTAKQTGRGRNGESEGKEVKEARGYRGS